MDERVPAVAEQLLLIERELRVQGWWGDEAPSREALASEQPFCVDSLRFEQWLQWIFLPSMKHMLENDAALPNASGIRPMAEQAFAGQEARATRLVDLLGRFDRLIGDAA